ncbi:MAG: ATP-binding protein [Oscillospiraceae bacterium]|nr:ATP-binding protein [Oscillospiraceae bacterium]
MNFNQKYYVQAENELKNLRRTNAKELELRRCEIERVIPEYTKLRKVMAATGARIAEIVIKGGDTDAQLAVVQEENTAAAARIRELLVKARKPADYLDHIYSCKNCLDTGIVGGIRCDCYKNRVKRLAAEGINSTSPLTLTGFESFSIELYPDVEKDGLNIRNSMHGVLNYCREYADEFCLPNTGLLLIGETGLGKTHLSLAIAGRVLSRGFNAVYGSAPDLFRKIENEHFGRGNENTMESLQSAELLVIDDIGAEFNTELNISIFYNLFNSRMNGGKATVINTNLSLTELRARYGDRINSRFLTMKILKFYGNDIRQIKRKAAYS